MKLSSSNYLFEQCPTKSASTTRYRIRKDNVGMTWQQVLRDWEHSAPFRNRYTEALRKSAFTAFFWEHPPITTDHLEVLYEFTLTDAPMLARVEVDADAFRRYFTENQQVVDFANLGGDAQLVVPCPQTDDRSVYTHLASFVRGAERTQLDALWSLVATVVRERLDSTPCWLSTSGLGVHWLHVRIDERPKYYVFPPYRSMAYQPLQWQ